MSPHGDLPPPPGDGARLVHTSDLHLGLVERHPNLDVLATVAELAERVGADALLLLGDVFDHTEIADAVVDEAAAVLDAADVPTAILPGNHDCLVDGRYMRGRLNGAAGVTIVDGRAAVAGLELWGRAHRNFAPLNPFAGAPRRRPDTHHIGLGHGHWDAKSEDLDDPYRFGPAELADHDFDYVALGHWDRFHEVVPGVYYSGSPQFTGAVNVVDLTASGARVHRVPVEMAVTAPRRPRRP